MKKLIKVTITLFFLTLCISSSGQEIKYLDEANGFKIFKINSEINNYINNLCLVDSNKDLSTYKYCYKEDFVIINKIFETGSSQITIYELAQINNTTPEEIKSLNSEININRNNILKKGQALTIPEKVVKKKYPIDEKNNYLFDNRINNIYLTFDNNTRKLLKIRLDISKEYDVNQLKMLGWYLKKLYYNFEEIIGPTTQFNRPTKDCLNPSTTCLYFENLVVDGKILWVGENISLKITHKIDYKIYFNGTSSLLVNNQVIFIDKAFELKEKLSNF